MLIATEPPMPRNAPPIVPAPPERTLDPDEIPVRQRRALLELDNEHCRFAFGHPGEPGFFFCGAPEADFAGGRPYCSAHHKFAYRRREVF